MQQLTVDQIIRKIQEADIFEAEASDGSFQISISEYVPYVCTAIHEGHQLRDELKEKIIHSDYERWYEEDPGTADFIESFPIQLIGLDSRFEYDLNRGPENAVYEDAWGKPVWKKPLSNQEKELSLQKHKNFYRVVHTLAEELEKKYNACLFYDIHSYNYKRWERVTPVFNIGCKNVDQKKYGSIIRDWKNELSKIELPHVESVSAINDVFFGNGYLLKYVTSNFDYSLVLATEVKKVFCDELTGEMYPAVVRSIHEGFKKAITTNAFKFIKKFTNLSVTKSNGLLSKNLDKNIKQVDKMLYKLVQHFELLNYVNPKNTETEKKRFFQAKFNYQPEFRHRQLSIHPFELKRKLHQLPIENIHDVDVRFLYQSVINSYADKIDLLSTLGTSKFLYNSLRYFGEPSEKDIKNAKHILYCKPYEEEPIENIGMTEAKKYFQEVLQQYQFDCKITVSDKIVSKALVLNSKKTVVLKKGATFNKKSLISLAHHEIGVHMVTTMNSNLQPLKILNLGLPVNTKTQEGLAVLTEYYCNGLTLKRLRELALRVLAINSMIQKFDFQNTFNLLHFDYEMDPHEAFYLTTRVYRGGGFTKDYLYLKGLVELMNYMKSGKSVNNLLIGKTTLEHLDTINELVDRKYFKPPKYFTLPLMHKEKTHPNLDYILSNLE